MIFSKRSTRSSALVLFVTCFIIVTVASGFCDSQLMVAVKKSMEEDYEREQVLGDFMGLGYGVRLLGTDEAGCWSTHSSFSFSDDPVLNWNVTSTMLFNDVDGPATFEDQNSGLFTLLASGTMEMALVGTSQMTLGQISEARDYLLFQFDTQTRESQDTRLRLGIAVREGAGPYDNSSLTGSYAVRLMTLSDFQNSNKNALVGWGTINFDGQSTYEMEYSNLNSQGESGNGTATGTYTIESGGHVVLLNEQGLSFLEGYISYENNVFILANAEYTTENYQNTLLFGFQEAVAQSPFALGDLVGDYSYAGIRLSNLATGTITDQQGQYNYGTINFDGQGNFTVENNAFISSGASEDHTFAGTYTITPQGEVTLTTTTSDGQPLEEPNYQTGNLSNDLQLFVFNLADDKTVDATSDETDTDTQTGEQADGDGGGGGGGCFIGSLN